VSIYRNGVYLRPPIKFTTDDNSQPVFIISTEPDIDRIDTNTNYESIKLAIGQNADYKDYKNSSLQLMANGEVMIRIPIYFMPSTLKLIVNICLKDAYEQHTSRAQETAILSVSNTALGIDEIRTPTIEFAPSSINRSDTRILASLSGSAPGLVSMTPIENDLFTLLSQLNGQVSAVLNPMLPILNALDMQSIRMATLYSDFVQKIQKIFPPSLIDPLTNDTIEKFLRAIGDNSELGVGISSSEAEQFEVLSTYFLLLTDCKQVHVNMTELDEAMQCVSSLESECPILHRRRRNVRRLHLPRELMLADGPVDVINHLSKLNGQVPAVLNPMLPILNALDMQSIRMATLYSDFVQKIQKIFPPSLIDPLTNDTIEKFLRAIGDNSELGVGISPSEAEQFEDKELINLWNATVNDWTSGRMDSPNENQGIAYSDVKQLVIAADRLHSVTRQNGASDPFSLLHEYVEQILTTNDSGDEQCLSAAVIIDPTVVYEDSSVNIDVYVQNLQNVTLTNIDLSIDFVRNDIYGPRINFGVGPSWSAGINTMSGFGILTARASFEMHWTRKIIAENRLTTSAFYQAVILLGFHKDGVPSKQRLKSPLIEIRPRRSIRVR
ncbi:unnamed protein product, partial [Strongylus vulgaris]